MCELPACITNVVSRCLPMGECTMAFGASDAMICFANGIKLKATFMVGAELMFSTQTLNPDGTVCFANDGMSMGDGITVNFRDAAGAVFASTTSNRTTMMGSVTCAGEAPITVDAAMCGPAGMMMMGGGMMMMPMCTGTGTCM